MSLTPPAILVSKMRSRWWHIFRKQRKLYLSVPVGLSYVDLLWHASSKHKANGWGTASSNTGEEYKNVGYAFPDRKTQAVLILLPLTKSQGRRVIPRQMPVQPGSQVHLTKKSLANTSAPSQPLVQLPSCTIFSSNWFYLTSFIGDHHPFSMQGIAINKYFLPWNACICYEHKGVICLSLYKFPELNY